MKRGQVDERIVDEKVELSAVDLGDFFMSGLDALGFSDVQGDDAHAQGLKLGQDGRVAGRRDDMNAYSAVSKREMQGD